MNHDNQIWETLQNDFEYLQEEGYEVLGVFLFGSQNYGCALDTSDIDVKAIVIPSVQQMIHGDTEIKLTIKGPGGELTVFDIVSMHKSFKKQNINFMEILFTEFRIINPKYEKLYSPMFEEREHIARMNPFRCIHAQYGNAENKYKKFLNPCVSNAERIEKYGYDNKALADVLRYEDFISKFLNLRNYSDCLIASRPDYLKWLKTGDSIYSLEEATQIMEKAYNHINEMCMNAIREGEDKCDSLTLNIIDEVTENCCRAYIKERCYIESWPTLSY